MLRTNAGPRWTYLSRRPSRGGPEGFGIHQGRKAAATSVGSMYDGVEGRDTVQKATMLSDINMAVDKVRTMLELSDDGEISISAYDTAWVALVEDVDGSGRPQFPAAIEWIAKNQLEDGSWGDKDFSSSSDRILCTLACVVALKSWQIHSHESEKGIKFLKENISRLKDEDEAHMPSGFENTLHALMATARDLEMEIPFDHPALQEIYARREIKFSSLEGIQMEGLNWENILRLQCDDGSFCTSPSSTAFALMQTKDPKCLDFLNRVTQRFDGGAPGSYPVEIFERLWVVDRLQRLGISRYFKEKLEEFVDYASRHWTTDGLGWTRYATVRDVDDTAMGFRLLRLHGRPVSPEVFEKFKSDDKFFTFAGETTDSVTPMHNLFRASQLRFPGETILETASHYASEFLTGKREANDWLDKWVIAEGLPSEVGYALDVPFYASLPRLETRYYLEQYGGESTVWIGKSYYRMANIDNNVYIELALMDYNKCQSLHLSEWDAIQRWYSDWKLDEFGVSRKCLLHSIFVAAATIFEPERSMERIAWAKSAVLVEAISSSLGDAISSNHRKLFLREFDRQIKKEHFFNERANEVLEGLAGVVVGILDQMTAEAGSDISLPLCDAWEKWMKGWGEDGEMNKGIVELLVCTILLFGSEPTRHLPTFQDTSSYQQYRRLCDLTSDICLRLAKIEGRECAKDPQIQMEMQLLSELVFGELTPGVDRDLKMFFFEITRGFYYSTYFDDFAIDQHISKVLFDNVLDI
ncbi:hypothetical protein MLD38_031818 [Melastoma candidum]|uniref:Uncharacterized protein n=1 Tax=Melastoma candidum TaxID=119954 RepID=A0ACB9MSM5_9MYRT|nr:hypothetical protein MLD38_031818 [Melastoma candidum]